MSLPCDYGYCNPIRCPLSEDCEKEVVRVLVDENKDHVEKINDSF